MGIRIGGTEEKGWERQEAEGRGQEGRGERQISHLKWIEQ